MKVEFKKAIVPREINRLVRFDRTIFRGDAFDEEMWSECEAWWMVVDRRTVGCCGFQWNKGFQKSLDTNKSPTRKGSLLIESTGILPVFQGFGFGKVMKAWQIAYARYWRFKRVVTNCRKSNRKMIDMNLQFGFRKVMTVQNYYEDPKEATVVMELILR